MSLTTATEVKSLTAGNDTVDGGIANSVNADSIVDASTTDADVLNAKITSNYTAGVIANVETINLDANGFANLSVAADSITNGKMFLSNSQVGGATQTTVTGLGATSQGLTLSVGQGTTPITTLVLTGVNDAAVTSVANVELTGGTSFVLTNTDNATTDVDVLNISSKTAANTATLTASAQGSYLTANSESINVTGDQNITLRGQVDTTTPGNNALAGATLTKNMTGTAKVTVGITGAVVATNADLTKVAADTIQLTSSSAVTTTAAGNVSFNIANGATFDIANALQDGSSNFKTITLTAPTATATTNAVNLVTSGDALNAGNVITVANAKTVAYNNSSTNNQTLTDTSFGTANVTVAGGKDVSFSDSDNGTTTKTIVANSIDASSLTGKLAIELDGAGVLTVTGGSGADTFELWNAANYVLDGKGNAADKVKISANSLDFSSNTAFSLSNIEQIDLSGHSGATTVTMNGSVISGQTISVTDDTATGTFNVKLNAAATDLSNINGNNVKFVLDNTAVSAIALNIKGSQVVDSIVGGTVNDTIDAGAGNDTITGGLGADSITASAGDDVVYSDNAGNKRVENFVVSTNVNAQTVTMEIAGQTITATSSTTGDLTIAAINTALQASTYHGKLFTSAVTANGDTTGNDDVLVITSLVDGNTVSTGKIASTGVFNSGSANTVTNSTQVTAGTVGTVGADIVSGGAGADVIAGGGGADVLTGGAGVDAFYFLKAQSTNASATSMGTIADYRSASGDNAAAADVIILGDVVAVAGTQATVVDYTAQATLDAALNAAAAANANAHGLTVFLHGGNTYAYVESNSGTTYNTGDFVVKITGTPFAAGTAISGLGIDGV